jgi:hypothetical protein
VVADTPAIDGARIFGAIVPVVAVLGGFTCKSAFACLANTEGGELAQRASGTILDWPAALAHALGAQILAALVPVLAVFRVLAFRRTADSTIATHSAAPSRATAPAVASRLSAPNQRKYAQRADT